MADTKDIGDEMFMLRCLQLAQLGAGKVSTNPLVGCVIVNKGSVIGEGHHKRYGDAHAEVNAISSVKEKKLLQESTLYVNLEPCAHYGKTPPCADLIVKHKLKRVVIGTVDTFSKVAGKGVERLLNAGIEVKTGILEIECRKINKRFFTYHEQQRPYIILKWAQTADGFMGRAKDDPESKRISNKYTDILVHRWRTEEDAILVGTTTAIEDNPKLTARLWNGRSPIRVVLDYDLKIPPNHFIFDGMVKTVVINAKTTKQERNVYYEKLNTKDLQELLKVLYKYSIQSLIVEGGAKLLNSFIEEKLWDEARIITSPNQWGKGVKAPEFTFEKTEEHLVENDRITTYRAEY